MCVLNAHYSEGDGHYFPVRTLRESENPLLANEEKWMEDGGSDEENAGKMDVTVKGDASVCDHLFNMLYAFVLLNVEYRLLYKNVMCL